MEKDPFSQILDLIRKEISENIPKTIVTGIVKSPFPNLIVESNGIPLDNDDLEIDFRLKRELETPLNKGDKVVMYKQGDVFLIISKVVKI